MSKLHFVPYGQDEKAGIIVVSIFALLSSLALLSVAVRVLWLAIRHRLSDTHATPEYVFFNTQLGHYATCLLVANLFSEVSGLIGFRWLIQQGITEGTVCTTQAILSQIGNWATAYFTVVIAVHTFNSLVLRIRQSILVCTATICVGWILASLLAGGPFFNPRAYKFGTPFGANGLSCGIRPVYLKAQFFFHLFPIFLASVLSAILYSVIFLILRGTLNIKGGISLIFDPNERWVVGKVTENYHRFVARVARSMLWYPVVYIILLVPYSVTRLLQISGWSVPFGALVFAYTCWFMLGVVNVLLLYNTFRVLGLAFGDHPTSITGSANESFGTPELFRRSKGLWGSYKETADTYSRPVSQRYSQFFEQTSSAFSDCALLLVHPERAASVQSFYRCTPSPPVGHHIMPAADLHRRMASFDSAYSPTLQLINDHDRKALSYLPGLPAAPRRQRSPVLRLSDIESNGSRSPTVNAIGLPVHPQPFKSSTDTRRRPGSPNSAFSVQSSPTHCRFTRGSTNSAYTRPMLSAVTPTFPSPRSPSLHSAFLLSAVSMTGPGADSHRTELTNSVGNNNTSAWMRA